MTIASEKTSRSDVPRAGFDSSSTKPGEVTENPEQSARKSGESVVADGDYITVSVDTKEGDATAMANKKEEELKQKTVEPRRIPVGQGAYAKPSNPYRAWLAGRADAQDTKGTSFCLLPPRFEDGDDERDPVSKRSPERSKTQARPRLTRNGPYTNLLTVHTPSICTGYDGCSICYNFYPSDEEDEGFHSPEPNVRIRAGSGDDDPPAPDEEDPTERFDDELNLFDSGDQFPLPSESSGHVSHIQKNEDLRSEDCARLQAESVSPEVKTLSAEMTSFNSEVDAVFDECHVSAVGTSCPVGVDNGIGGGVEPIQKAKYDQKDEEESGTQRISDSETTATQITRVFGEKEQSSSSDDVTSVRYQLAGDSAGSHTATEASSRDSDLDKLGQFLRHRWIGTMTSGDSLHDIVQGGEAGDVEEYLFRTARSEYEASLHALPEEAEDDHFGEVEVHQASCQPSDFGSEEEVHQASWQPSDFGSEAGSEGYPPLLSPITPARQSGEACEAGSNLQDRMDSGQGRKVGLCLPTDWALRRVTCACRGDMTMSYNMRVAVVRPGGTEDHEEEEASMGDPDMVIKHPLQNSWAMWFFKNDKSRDWKDNLRVITTFDTVEDFWGLYNHTLPASKLQSGCDYSVFKAGIQPMWEDVQNKKGGRWLINLNKSQRQPHLDDLWLETLLCLIGEGFDEYSDDICGATVNIRTKGDKLGLWTRDASRNDATKKIGMKLKESLNVPPKIVIGFQAHSDTAGKAGSTVKNRFTV